MATYSYNPIGYSFDYEIVSKGLIDKTGRAIIPMKPWQQIVRHEGGIFGRYNNPDVI